MQQVAGIQRNGWRLTWPLGLALLGGLFLWRWLQPSPVAMAAPTTGETCFATPNNGTTVYSSTTAQAVRDAVNAAPVGGSVKVAGYCPGVQVSGGTTQTVLLTKTLTLAGGYTTTNWTTANPVGYPTTLDAQSGGRVIVASAAVTLQTLTVQNGQTANDGAGLYATGPITLQNMTLRNNTATSAAWAGGAYFAGQAVVRQTSFVNNQGCFGAGASFLSTTSVQEASFMGNSTVGCGDGGGARFFGPTSVVSSTFTNNTAPGGFGGGAIFWETSWITNTTFVGNTADGGGGGAAFGNNGVFFAMRVVNGLFARNSSTAGAGVWVGLGAEVRLLHSTIAAPVSASGPAAYTTLSGQLYLTNTIVTSHTTGLANNGGALQAWNTLFYGNTTDTSGVVTSTSPISGQPRFANPGIDDYRLTAGSAAIDAGTPPMPNVAFDFEGHPRPNHGAPDIGYDEYQWPFCFTEYTGDNVTDFSSPDAQAVRDAVGAAAPNGIVKLAGYCAGVQAQGGTTQTVVISKSLTLIGGYVPTDWTQSNPLANPTTLDALSGGRVISTANVAVTLQGFTVTNGYISSTVTAHGGGIFAGGALTLTDMVVYSNTVRGSSIHDGGGAYVVGPAAVTGTTFKGNVAYRGGGAYFSSPSTITGSTFSTNTGSYGGGAYFLGTATLTGATFRANTSFNDGGGAQFDRAVKMTGTTFSGNSTGLFGLGGGARFMDTATLTNTSFTTNTSRHGGGAYFLGAATLTDSAFSANTAYYSGGGAHFQNAVAVTATTFSANRAFWGGGVLLSAAFPGETFPRQFVNVLFARNWASDRGAALFAQDIAPLSLLHTTIVSPTVSTGAAAIYVVNGTVYLTNTLVASQTVGIANETALVSEWHSLYAGVSTPYSGSVSVTGSVTGTAAFADPTNDNYHLILSSAAIDAGTPPNPDVPLDFEGDGRTALGYDIGYDEFRSTYALHVATAGSGSGVVTPTVGVYTYTYGSVVTLTAAANTGSTFTGWSVSGAAACSGTGSCVLTLTGNQNVTANFALNLHTLTVATAGTGSGLVTPTVGVYTYTYGSIVTLTASPNVGSTFSGWSVSGATACSGTGSCVLTLTSNQSVSANFTVNTYPLTIAMAGPGSGVVTPTTGVYTYPHGTSLTLTAAANLGSTFTGWSGGCSGTGSCGVTLTGPQTVTAQFGLANCLAEWTGDNTIDFASLDAQAVRDAVAAAPDGGTVKIAGTCAGRLYYPSLGEFAVVALTKTLTLAGGYTATNWTQTYPVTQPTTLDGQGTGRGIFANAPVTLRGFTVANGVNYDFGGGLRANAAITLAQMVFVNNATVQNGPGGAYFVGPASIAQTIFRSNQGPAGGAGAWFINSAQLVETTFSQNVGGAQRFMEDPSRC